MRATISGVVETLEHAWSAIQAHHPELPDVVIIVASGHEGKRKKFGHHARLRWTVEGDAYTEIMVSGEGLKRGAAPVMTTLLHESAHALADVRGIQDTSRQGRYHNKQFKAIANEVGIEVEKDSSIGWSVSEMGALGQDRYGEHIDGLEKVLTLYRNSKDDLLGVLGGGEDPTPKAKTTVLCICACEPARKIRMKVEQYEVGSIVCGVCEEQFAEEL